MDRETQDEMDLLLGRIIALEEIIITIVAAQARGYASPSKEVLAGWLDAIKRSAQLSQRPIGDRPDAAWENAVRGMEAIFARAAMRDTESR